MGTILKRRNSKGQITYTSRIRRRGFPHITATFSRLTDAKNWIEQEEAKIRQGLHIDYIEAKKHSLSEAIDRYLKEENPHPNRITHLKRWKQELGALLLSAITEIRINDIISKWKNNGYQESKPGPATLNRYLNSLSMVFRGAKEWGWSTRNPVLDAKKNTEPKGRVRYLSDSEREKLLSVCQKDEFKKLYLIVVLAISTGMRKGEILGLTWSQIDLKAGTIILTITKNKERRRVSVTSKALELFRLHEKTRRLDSEFVFPGENISYKKDGKGLSINERHYDIKRPWLKLIKHAGISDFKFHDLRHSCASYLAMNGASSLEIAEILGHKSLDVVKRYSHLSEKHTAKVIESMNKKIFGDKNNG